MTVVRQRFGTAVMSEVLEESVNTATQQVLTDRGLRAAAPAEGRRRPSCDGQAGPAVHRRARAAARDPDARFRRASQLTRLQGRRPADEAIDKALERDRQRASASCEPVTEDRGAQTGDTLTVDFVGKVDGVPFPGGTGTDMAVELGGSGFIPGFSEGMEGMKPGEERQIAVTFPEDYHAKDSPGRRPPSTSRPRRWSRPSRRRSTTRWPTKLGFENLDELRDVITQQIQREYDSLSRMRIKRDLLDALAEQARVPGAARAWSRPSSTRSGSGSRPT